MFLTSAATLSAALDHGGRRYAAQGGWRYLGMKLVMALYRKEIDDS